ncbi:MAG TPA: ABC transporter permease subunit [Terriglobia bacterium]|nr:ABC transporter permease subunit [Terriglobia bacterium]
MFRQIIRRILGSIPTLFALATVTFFVTRIAPGGPFSSDKKLPAEVIAKMNAMYHLDEPLWMQYGRFLKDVIHFNLGPSMYYKEYSVAELIHQGFPISLEIGAWATLIYVFFGLLFGFIAALKRNGIVDYAVMTLAMGGIVIPTFVIAPMLQIAFGVAFHFLPVGGWDGSWRSMILPICAMALPNIAYVARLTRGSVIEVLRSNYIRTARAKGVGEWQTLSRHALVAAMMPVIAYLGPATAALVTGSMVIETIFAIPGIGRYFVQSAIDRDYTMVMGVTLIYGSCIILFNMVTDLIQALLDPRSTHG